MTRVTLPNEVLLSEVARLIKAGGTVTIKVKGNSMLPFITGERDSVILRRAGKLKRGDIVLAKLENGQYVLHRIIALNAQRITLMGDGNLYGTEKCPRTAIAGQAIRILRRGKTINCTSPAQRRWAALWRRLLPVRRYLLAIYRRIT